MTTRKITWWPDFRGIRTVGLRRSLTCSPALSTGDSLGNKGKMAGDVQWLTAGSGILHQEMPNADAQGRMHGFSQQEPPVCDKLLKCPHETGERVERTRQAC